MSKETKKRISYNAEILILMEKKWGVSIDFVRKCIRGDRTGVMPDRIKKDYFENLNSLNTTVKDAVEKLKNL